MIKEALQYLIGLAAPHREEIDGIEYSDRKLVPIFHDPRRSCLSIHTLTGIIDYIDKVELDDTRERLFLHIESPSTVHLYGEATGPEMNRTHYVESTLFGFNGFSFGKFVDHEKFMIDIQTLFVQTEELFRLIQTIGKMKHESTIDSSDDGVTQTIRSAKGVVLTEGIVIKNPFILQPFRTFGEVDQPESLFTLRVRGKEGSSPECALYESDGTAWKIKAVQNIRAYFAQKLKSYPILA